MRSYFVITRFSQLLAQVFLVVMTQWKIIGSLYFHFANNYVGKIGIISMFVVEETINFQSLKYLTIAMTFWYYKWNNKKFQHGGKNQYGGKIDLLKLIFSVLPSRNHLQNKIILY